MSVEINNESGIAVDEARLQRLASFVLESMFVHADTELSLMFVDEAAIEQLHVQWMDEPGATDVLSFPMDELRPGRPDAKTPAGLLGDIVVCPQVAEYQAEAAGHSLEQEITVLVVHGMLHLLGFDHGTPDEEAEMFGLQRDLVLAFSTRERTK
ncbi:rRNA maturation RNase YbeY [Leucobacter denitrificans]|uniref:Endoribonuclease YbeY n=1 Tax=Leucobacter denitrificans TaxID=683042 RepID=A0A7G9S5H0_9MICO|nr:rRNA maturation RNase YbeY [Leucobacter denitrificans]QNN63095.1 rRNA maturation RNase YbeY [Leucobacter denitrificans]